MRTPRSGQQPAPASKKIQLRSRTEREAEESGHRGEAEARVRPPAGRSHPLSPPCPPAPCRRGAHLSARPRPLGAAHGLSLPLPHTRGTSARRSRSPRGTSRRRALSATAAARYVRSHPHPPDNVRSPLPPTPPRSAAHTRRPGPAPRLSPPQREGCRNAPPAHAQNAASSRLLGTILAAGGARARRKWRSRPRCFAEGALLGPAVRRWAGGVSAEAWDAIHSDLDKLR